MATLEELRAQAAAKQAEREAQVRASMEVEEIKLRELLAEKKLELNVDVAALYTKSGKLVAAKKPTRVAHKAFMNGVNKGTITADVIEGYLKGMLFYPSERDLQDILDESPGMLSAIVNKANDLIAQSEAELGNL